jgi:hypothetical protein
VVTTASSTEFLSTVPEFSVVTCANPAPVSAVVAVLDVSPTAPISMSFGKEVETEAVAVPVVPWLVGAVVTDGSKGELVFTPLMDIAMMVTLAVAERCAVTVTVTDALVYAVHHVSTLTAVPSTANCLKW